MNKFDAFSMLFYAIPGKKDGFARSNPDIRSARERFFLSFLCLNAGIAAIAAISALSGLPEIFTFFTILKCNLLILPFAFIIFAFGCGVLPELSGDVMTKENIVRILFSAALAAVLFFFAVRGFSGTNFQRLERILLDGFLLYQIWTVCDLKALGADKTLFHDLPDDILFIAGGIIIMTIHAMTSRTLPAGIPMSCGGWIALLGTSSLPVWIGEVRRAYLYYDRANTREN